MLLLLQDVLLPRAQIVNFVFFLGCQVQLLQRIDVRIEARMVILLGLLALEHAAIR